MRWRFDATGDGARGCGRGGRACGAPGGEVHHGVDPSLSRVSRVSLCPRGVGWLVGWLLGNSIHWANFLPPIRDDVSLPSPRWPRQSSRREQHTRTRARIHCVERFYPWRHHPWLGCVVGMPCAQALPMATVLPKLCPVPTAARHSVYCTAWCGSGWGAAESHPTRQCSEDTCGVLEEPRRRLPPPPCHRAIVPCSCDKKKTRRDDVNNIRIPLHGSCISVANQPVVWPLPR